MNVLIVLIGGAVIVTMIDRGVLGLKLEAHYPYPLVWLLHILLYMAWGAAMSKVSSL